MINDFLCFLLSNDNFVLDFALMQYGTPTKKCLADNADVRSDIVLGAVADNMDRFIYPGAYPDSYHSVLKKYFYDEQGEVVHTYEEVLAEARYHTKPII